MSIRSNTTASYSLSCSPMDSSPPSKEDYAERMASISKKMNFKMSNPEMEDLYSSSSGNNTMQHSVNNEVVSNATLQPDLSTIPITPSAIPYETNVSANLNLWDSHFCHELSKSL